MSEENFVDDNHALRTGMVLGLLIRHLVDAEPDRDNEGNYLDTITISGDEYGTFRIRVLP